MRDRNKVLFGFVMLLMVIGIISFSYAIFTTKVEKKGALNIVAGTLSCPIQIEGQESNQIELVNQTEKEIEVTIRNDSQVPIHSTITYSVNDNVEVLISSNDDKLAKEDYLSTGETRTYTIKLINKGTNTEIVTLNGRCGLSNKELAIANSEKEITGNYEKVKPNEPKLVEGLIPVIYDESQESWVKADTTKTWYNYDKQEWANAVTVKETGTSNRIDYMNAASGTLISIDDINTMWVWIPRYEYKFTNLGDQYAGGTQAQPGEIVVNFLNGTNDTPSNEKYKVHPAFTFGEDELTGIWYGKFEPSNEENKVVYDDSNSTDSPNNLELTPIIKPNVISWEYISVSNAFYTTRNMQTKNFQKYGFSNDLESYDIHMSKNNEWGAVAYLSQSRYGKYGNENYIGVEKEVVGNNCSSGITGAGGNSIDEPISDISCENTYETAKGQAASTTGNITGVYDMSGGKGEYVMGAFGQGTAKISHSGFNDSTKPLPELKYYDLFYFPQDSTNSVAEACNGDICYGQALSETRRWYRDYAVFLHYDGAPWLQRGGMFNFDVWWYTGIMGYTENYAFGYAKKDYTFRIVLVPIGQ